MLTVVRPVASSSCRTATSRFESVPTTVASYVFPVVATVTSTLVAHSTTWWLVTTRPSEASTMPVPAAVPGIVFLSGGQSDEQASENLNAINQRGTLPWQATFSFGRGLLAPALHDWAGKAENVQKAQKTLAHRSKLNAAARDGKYDPSLEQR